MVNFVVTALIAFISTALDDFVVQLYFMSKATIIEDENERHTAFLQIVIGTVLSNVAVIAMALLGLVFEVFVSQEWISLLGFFPLVNGLWGAYDLIKELDSVEEKMASLQSGIMSFVDPMSRTSHHGGDVELLRSHHGEMAKGDSESGAANVDGAADSSNPILMSAEKKKFAMLPQADDDEEDLDPDGRTTNEGSLADEERITITTDGDGDDDDLEKGAEGKDSSGGTDDGTRDDDGSDDGSEDSCPVDQDEIDSNVFSGLAKRFCGEALSPLALEVLVMNLAVSSDNVVIYTTVFVTESLGTVFLTVFLVLACVLLTLVLALFTARMQSVNKFFQDYSEYLIPPLLIALGCYILSDSIIFHH
jgi:cadmium resistance protein CadD (predicted permease)